MRYHTPRCLLWAFAFVCLMTTSAATHDVWLTTIREGEGTIRALVHYGHPGDRSAPITDKLFEFRVMGDDRHWRSLLTGLQPGVHDDAPILQSMPLPIVTGVGLWLLAASYDNGYWVKTPEGFRNTSKRHMPTAERSVSTMKFAKALLAGDATPSDIYQHVVGHRLELIPLLNPLLLTPGDTLQVRVLLDGKPLAGAEVESGDGQTPRAEDEIPRYKTDANGIAEIPLRQPGAYVLGVEQALPALHPDLCDADRYNATFSFVLPSGR